MALGRTLNERLGQLSSSCASLRSVVAAVRRHELAARRDTGGRPAGRESSNLLDRRARAGYMPVMSKRELIVFLRIAGAAH